MIEMTFEWDENKARENERKHGVTFHEAKTVFGDPASIFVYDGAHSWAEDRFIIIGMSERDRILTVVYVERRDDDEADQRTAPDQGRETRL